MSSELEFPYLIVVGIVAFHVGFITLVIVYVCWKYKCCACSCFISCCSGELPSDRRETVIEVNAVRSRSTVHSSPENSRLPVMDPADPGMQHINRFLGRNPSDPGLQHINRFLGQEYFVSSDNNGNDNDSESDVGMQHVRRALGMVDSVTRTDTTRRTSAPSPIPRRISLDTYRPSSQSLQTLHNSSVPHDLNGNAQYIQRSRTDSAVAGGRDNTPNTSSGEDLSEQLPSYQEAITLLARQESELEIEPPPPRYEDVISEDFESV